MITTRFRITIERIEYQRPSGKGYYMVRQADDTVKQEYVDHPVDQLISVGREVAKFEVEDLDTHKAIGQLLQMSHPIESNKP